MNCAACGTSLAPGAGRCPACALPAGPPTDGALAHDLSRKVEPLREVPGLRKKERTWKDDVRDRVKERQRRRSEAPSPRTETDEPLGEDEMTAADAIAAFEFDTVMVPEPVVPVVPVVPAARTAPVTPMPAPPKPPSTDAMRIRRAPAPVDDPLDLPLNTGSPAPLRFPPPAAAVDPPRPAPRARDLERPAPKPASTEAWEMVEEPQAPPTPANQRPLATMTQRSIAGLIDAIVLGSVFAVVVYFASRVAQSPVESLFGAWPWLMGYFVFFGLTYAGYFTGTTGQTLGKIVCNVRVVDADGQPLGYLRSFLRAAIGLVSSAALFAGFVPALLDPQRRALHDRVVGTRVIQLD